MRLSLCFFAAGLMGFAGVASAAEPSSLTGYAEGAQVMRVAVTGGQIDTISGLIYEQVKDLRAVHQLRMTLLIPRNADLKPAIIYFPGGGFISADHEKYIEMRMALAKAGFVVAAAEYRVVPDVFPAPVVDGKAAVRYLRAHASEYGIDPNRIAVFGDSAGGYLAQMLGTTNGVKEFDKGDFLDQSSDVQAAVTLYGLSNLLNIGAGFPDAIQKVHASPAVTEALLVHGPAFAAFPGASIFSDPQKALYASPMGHVEGKKPPFLILHGSGDTLVSPHQSEQLYKALRSQNNKVEYVLLEGAGHGTIEWYQEPVVAKVVSWFKKTLGEPIPGTKKGAQARGNL